MNEIVENKFFSLIYRSRYIERWATSNKKSSDNLSEHIFSTTMISLLLANIYMNEIGKELIKYDELLLFSLFRDIEDIYTAHIIGPIKKQNIETQKMFKEIKNIFSKKFFLTLPQGPNIFLKKLDVAKKNNLIQEITESSDIIDAYIFCELEVMSGNNDFKAKAKEFREKVEKIKKKKYVKIFFEEYFDIEKIELIY